MQFKKIHSWNLNYLEAKEIQHKLKKKIKINRYLKKPPRLIAACDVAFGKRMATGVVVVVDYPSFKLIEQVQKTTKISYPYVPGLLTFREGPVLEKCFRALKHEPEVIIFDGQGIAHPRKMGIATHLGILLNKPTVGCAKTRLYGDYQAPANYRGAFSYLFGTKKEKIGVALRSKKNVRPVFVSPGYKMDIPSSLEIILLSTKKYRLPEPMRLAHQLSKKLIPAKANTLSPSNLKRC